MMNREQLVNLTVVELNNVLVNMTTKEIDKVATTLEYKLQIVGFWKMKKADRIDNILKLFSKEREEMMAKRTTEEKAKSKAKSKRPSKLLKVVLLDGTEETFDKASTAVKLLNLKNKNCFCYWTNGKAQKAMNSFGIKECYWMVTEDGVTYTRKADK